MTQALNLANFANNLNTAGATSNTGLQNSSVTVTAGTGMSGGGAVALGSSVTLTNDGVTSIVAGTGISVSGATGAVTITNSSTSPYVGFRGQAFTSSGTFTIPTGVTAVKVTALGGGGGGGQYAANGGAGGNSSVSTIIAYGGGGGIGGAGGGTNGGRGSNSGGVHTLAINVITSTSYVVFGSNGGGNNGGRTCCYPNGGNGGLGGTCVGFLTGLTSGGTLSVTVGAAGTGSYGNPGTIGYVLIEW